MNNDEYRNENSSSSDDECDPIITDDYTKNQELQINIKKWALGHNINHAALRGIIKIINARFGKSILPEDPRTLLKTPRSVSIVPIGNNGQYWHSFAVLFRESIFEYFESD